MTPIKRAFFVSMIMLTSALQAATDATPIARIDAYDAAIVAIVRQALPMKARVDQFAALVNAYYDMPGIAATVIGPGWAQASAADREAVTRALARHSAVSLAKNFTGSPPRFAVDPAVQQRGENRIVKVSIGSDTLYFQMRQAKGVWAIVDVISGGVSQLAVQRADLAGTAAAGGAAAVAKRLEQVDAKAVGGR